MQMKKPQCADCSAHTTRYGAIKWATGELKAAGIEAPEATPQAPQPPTPEELQQLTEWIDGQSDPEAITVEQADAWLRGRRASSSDADP